MQLSTTASRWLLHWLRLVGRNDHTRLTPLLESSMQLTCRAIMLIVQAHQCQSWGRIIRRGGTDTPSHMIDVARGSMCCVGGGDEPVRCQQLLHLRIGQWTAHLIACDLVGRGDEAVSRKGNTMARTTSSPVRRLRRLLALSLMQTM